jgi:hypothetical protein
MIPYILKWDNPRSNLAGHLYKDVNDKIEKSVAIVIVDTEEEKEKFTRFIEAANIAWEQIQGM